MTINPQDWTGTVLSGGRYLITAKLGEGGMGAVYRARDGNIDAEVVVKVPLRVLANDPEFSRRFTDEIRSLVKLSHPHIVKVTDVGDWDGLPFAVMQYLPGGSLDDRRGSGGGFAGTPTAAADALGWLAGIADALDYVHSQGYIHRDVKPGNILFDARGHAFLGDFGVVKALVSSADAAPSRTAMTGAGMVIGTPEYMAPELIMGEPLDGRVDQYALAVTLYEVLGGRRPFEDEVKTKVLVHHTTKPPPFLSEVCGAVAPPLARAVHQGLAKDPGERYASCAAFAAAVLAAARSSRAEPPERVRFECRHCGKTLSVTAADFARLTQAGRRGQCPACKGVIGLSPGDGAAVGPTPLVSGAAGGGTLPMFVPAGSGTGPVAAQGGTVRLSAKAAPGVKTPARPYEPRPHRASTTVERAPSPAPKADADVLSGVSSNLVGPPGAWAFPKGVNRVTLGATFAFSLVVLTALGLGRGGGRGQSAAVTTGADAPVRDVRPTGPVPTRGDRPPREAGPPNSPPVEIAAAAPVAPSPTKVAVGTVEEPPPPPQDDREEMAAIPASNRALGDPKVPGEGGPSPAKSSYEPDLDPASIGAVPKAIVPLEKVLANPEAYGDQIVSLSRLYCVGTTAGRRADGLVDLAVIESDLSIEDGAYKVRRGTVAQVAVDPRTAENLFRIRRIDHIAESLPPTQRWDIHPAILSARVSRTGPTGAGSACRVLQFEFFEKFDNKIVAVGYKKALRVGYITLTVGPWGELPTVGHPDDWSRVTRLGHVYNQYQGHFKSLVRSESYVRWNDFNARLNRVIETGTRNAVREQMEVESFLRRKIGAR